MEKKHLAIKKCASNTQNTVENIEQCTRIPQKTLATMTLSQMVHFMCTCGLTMATTYVCPFSPQERRVSHLWFYVSQSQQQTSTQQSKW